MRVDKGSKAHIDGTPKDYLWRVMDLAKLEWQLLTVAIVTTVVTSAAALFVPKVRPWAFPKSRHTVCPYNTDTFFYLS